MNTEQKQLLLKDLCARLPYGVIITFRHNGFRWDWPQTLDRITKCEDGEYAINGWGLHGIKPFLRPMSSMTTEEWCDYCDACAADEADRCMAGNDKYLFSPISKKEDFLNSHHFDHHGLIPMGLALEAQKDMYKED